VQKLIQREINGDIAIAQLSKLAPVNGAKPKRRRALV